MDVRRHFPRWVCVVVSVALVTQLLGCGWMLYPERRGQTNGPIDPGVAILDAILLIPFIIPGVIAFAVDFTTGAIYYPSRRHRMTTPGAGRVAVIHLNPSDLNEQTICEAVRKYSGCPTRFTLSEAKVVSLHGTEEVIPWLEEKARTGYRADTSR